ncbi:MAG: citrate synthase [Clostridiales bacterium]|jgi:citrate synthase|nr:citrate synthase [Pygmaiobacter sp.]MDK2813647.1 citrate synthase [Clostridiales bacterium]
MEEFHTIDYLCDEYLKNNYIDPETSERLGVKRGLRNPDGTGVLAGLTNVCDVVGYEMRDGVRMPTDGRLIYRGIDVRDIVNAAYAEDRFIFEEVIWLLLFGSLPTEAQLEEFKEILEERRSLPENFVEDMIIKAPSPNIMNTMERSVLALYSYDKEPEDQSLKNILRQSVTMIASLPTIMVNAYQVKRRVYDRQSMYFHMPQAGQSTAEHILSTYRADQQYTHAEAKLLDLCLVLHADHGGGNNSTFACRVLSSTGTDTYSAIAAGIGSLKGPKHGGANIKVMQMLDTIKENVNDYDDDTEIKEFLRRLIRRQAGDRSGLIYGVGHAVYTKSDPRAVILRTNAEPLAIEKGFGDDFKLLRAVERLAPQVFAEEKGKKDICANVDLYSGLIYRMLGLSVDLYTPLFAISRIPGWCAHRVEEVVFANRIMRPAYKYLGVRQHYVSMEERK